MRRMRKNRIKRKSLHNNTKENKKTIKTCIFLAFVLFLSGGLYYVAENALRPVLMEIADIKVKEMVSIAINDAVAEKVLADATDMEFLTVDLDDSGNVSFINSNSVYMNRFASELTDIIHDKVANLEAEKVKVPIGSILGSEMFSQYGPEIDLKVKPLGNAKVDFKTEFDSSGINQTKYKVYLQVSSKAKPLIPFASDPIEISSVIPICETVIVGKVPQTYVSVPGMENKAIGNGNQSAGINAIGAGSAAGAVINGINLAELE